MKTEIMLSPENSSEKNKQAYLLVCLYEVIKYQE